MTHADQDAYRAAYAFQAKIAKQRREVIHHVTWRDGHMTTLMARPERAAASEPDRPSSSRGVVGQGQLI